MRPTTTHTLPGVVGNRVVPAVTCIQVPTMPFFGNYTQFR